MSEIYYDDPLASAPLKMKSRVIGDAVVPSHDLVTSLRERKSSCLALPRVMTMGELCYDENT
jgi:hypothetical protein